MGDIEDVNRMCRLMGFIEDSPMCRVVQAAMHSAKQTIKDWNGRRVFVQDFAAALNRRGLLTHDKYEDLVRSGYDYMEDVESGRVKTRINPVRIIQASKGDVEAIVDTASSSVEVLFTPKEFEEFLEVTGVNYPALKDRACPSKGRLGG